MKNITFSEENYLKTIYHLSKEDSKGVSTNAIASKIETKASSVTDMLKKLAEKNLVEYKKYQGVKLTPSGRLNAARIVRKHRLWEVFLVEKLNFSWDEVHEVAEQLEHIRSEKLIKELDAFLQHPKVDPHGDPIPDENGNIITFHKNVLASFKKSDRGICVGVKNSSSDFLQYLDKLNLSLGDTLEVLEIEPFDASMVIKNGTRTIIISALTAQNIYLQKI
ncbi:metal-dependent transcriptional regulator [Ascidiimonas sp. W6]|uniref:metal-dependent transcriptional regulator n=1 Tax=Ascidiimonas meishanensis TaxID=3128903 RepID=UPI0030EE00BD